MLRRISLISAVLSVLLLTGCTPSPSELGISEQQWQTMSDKQRQQILDGYARTERARGSNNVYAGPKIMVSISHGQAMMPPFTQAQSYQPVQFEMKPGECRHVTLTSVNGEHEVDLPACYNGLTLALDPSRYDPLLSGGSLRFNYIPIWKRGFAYNGVSSQGYVHLTKVRVIISAVVKEGEEVVTHVTPRHTVDLQTEPLKVQEPAKAAEPVAESPIELKNVAQQPEKTILEQIPEKKLAPVEDIENFSP
jgi:hypothetical protein